MADELTEASSLLFAQAEKQLQQQLADLDGLRTRAVALLSVASLIAGFFVSRLPKEHPPEHTTIAVWVALSAFVIGVVLTLLIAVPRGKWLFSFRLERLFELVEEKTIRSVDVTHNLARWSEDARDRNRLRLVWLYRLFAGLCVCVGIQVLAWGVAAL